MKKTQQPPASENTSERTIETTRHDSAPGLELEKVEDVEEKEPTDYEDVRETGAKLARACIGGKKQAYYMSAFLQQYERGFLPRARFNAGALFFSIFWMVYRKMYLLSVLVAAPLLLLTAFLSYEYSQNNLHLADYWFVSPTIDQSALITVVVISVFSGFYGNYLYYLHILYMSARAKRKQPTVSLQRKYLVKKGMVSNWAPVIALLVLSSGGYFAYAEIIVHQAVAREQMREALDALVDTKKLVASYKRKQGKWPDSKAGIITIHDIHPYKYIADISVVQQLVIVTFKNDDKVIDSFAGKSLAMFGVQEQTGTPVNWVCGSVNISLEHMPAGCRRHLNK